MSGAAFFGMAIISGSKSVFALSVISFMSHWWFLSNVEEYVLGSFRFLWRALLTNDAFVLSSPHMRKVYGPSLRKEAGLTKTIKKLAIKNAQLLEVAAPVAGVAKEFRGTVERVYEDAGDVVEGLLSCESNPYAFEWSRDQSD